MTDNRKTAPVQVKTNGAAGPEATVPHFVPGSGSVFDDLDDARFDDISSASPTRRVLTRISVKRPDKQWFFRVNSQFNFPCLIFEDRDENDMYFVHKDMREIMGDFARHVELHLGITRQGTLFLWPIKLDSAGSGGQWAASSQDAARQAVTQWVSIRGNRQAGMYDIFLAEGAHPEPEWPDLGVAEILKLGFGDKQILTADHKIVDRLRGK